VWIVLAASVILAQGPATPTLRPVTDNEVNRIAKNLYCPVCQNVPLEVCDTAACERWRAQIRDLLAQGKTEPEIREYFIQQFGRVTVGTPTDAVSHALTVVLPFTLIALIGIVIAVSLVRWRMRNHMATAQTTDTDGTERGAGGMINILPDDYRARLEAELREKD
jgi:cytochrome c-type biogenesis protein CcmH